MGEEPASTRVWDQGAVGEERVGQVLEAARSQGVEVLHDRRLPRSRANIDHLVVAPTGIWVVDAKRYVDGKVEVRDVGGWRVSDRRLYVRGRDQTKLVDGVAKQVAAVEVALLGTSDEGVPVRGALCFVDARVGWFAKPFSIHDVLVTWRAELVTPMLARPAEPLAIPPERTAAIARHLARLFRPARSSAS